LHLTWWGIHDFVYIDIWCTGVVPILFFCPYRSEKWL
jgi:hypothetical protein